MADDVGLPEKYYRPDNLPFELPPHEYVVSKSEEFQTKDLYLAAAILALKAGTLEDVDRHDRRHMRFLFAGKDLDRVEAKWINRALVVNAADFADGVRKMKSIIHEND